MTIDSDKPLLLQQGVSMPLMSRSVMRLTLLALSFALLAVWVVNDRLRVRYQTDLGEVFLFESNEIAFRIEERFRAYFQVLKGARGLFAASDVVDRGEWHAYVSALGLEQDYPGIQGLGFAQYLQADAVASHVLSVRDEGFPDYDVWPAGEREVYSAIVMLEPLDWRNTRAVGFDMYSEALRRDAMDRAVASGDGALSGPVTLVQETGQNVQTGVLLYLPVFINGTATETVDQRREALSGWVYSPFRMNDLIEATLDRFSEDVRVRVYDEAEALEALLYDSHADRPMMRDPQFRQVSTLTLNGREWVLVMDAQPGFGDRYLVTQIELAAIILVGVMFVLVTWSFAIMRERAGAYQRAATHDPLTGIPNRLMFADLMAGAISRAERYGEDFGLLFVDLDHFKPVNDTLGHAIGDRLLIEVVKRMQGAIRSSDIVGRHGGDEFVVLLPHIESIADLETVAEKINATLQQPFSIGEHEVRIGASIGIACFPADGSDIDTLIRHADVAMYRAKAAGRKLSGQF